jgi:hypothetical protein
MFPLARSGPEPPTSEMAKVHCVLLCDLPDEAAHIAAARCIGIPRGMLEGVADTGIAGVAAALAVTADGEPG